MKIEIFDIENGKIVVNKNCLLIPELKAVVEHYTNPIPALSYLYYRYDYASPYMNIPEDEKDEAIMKDFPGDYTLEDEVMIDACDQLQYLYITPTYRYYLDNKILMEKLGKFARETEVEAGRDGNYSAMLAQLKSVGKAILEFKQLEKVVMDEIKEQSSIRGGRNLGYDQL